MPLGLHAPIAPRCSGGCKSSFCTSKASSPAACPAADILSSRVPFSQPLFEQCPAAAGRGGSHAGLQHLLDAKNNKSLLHVQRDVKNPLAQAASTESIWGGARLQSVGSQRAGASEAPRACVPAVTGPSPSPPLAMPSSPRQRTPGSELKYDAAAVLAVAGAVTTAPGPFHGKNNAVVVNSTTTGVATAAHGQQSKGTAGGGSKLGNSGTQAASKGVRSGNRRHSSSAWGGSRRGEQLIVLAFNSRSISGRKMLQLHR